VVAHSALTDTAFEVVSSIPNTTPAYIGQVVAYISGNNRVFYVATDTDSSADWVGIGGTPLSGASDPNSSLIQARWLHDLYINTTDNTIWYAQSISNNDWEQLV
jgi:hypothetical protein